MSVEIGKLVIIEKKRVKVRYVVLINHKYCGGLTIVRPTRGET